MSERTARIVFNVAHNVDGFDARREDALRGFGEVDRGHERGQPILQLFELCGVLGNQQLGVHCLVQQPLCLGHFGLPNNTRMSTDRFSAFRIICIKNLFNCFPTSLFVRAIFAVSPIYCIFATKNRIQPS